MEAQRILAACGLFCVLAAAPAAAQLSAGRIVGTVTDPQKAAIPKATVVVTNTATNLSQTVATSDRDRSSRHQTIPG